MLKCIKAQTDLVLSDLKPKGNAERFFLQDKDCSEICFDYAGLGVERLSLLFLTFF